MVQRGAKREMVKSLITYDQEVGLWEQKKCGIADKDTTHIQSCFYIDGAEKGGS